MENNKRIAVYAGSFDPITLGHLWVIEQASKLFDKVYVVVATNGDKKGFLPANTRCRLITEATKYYLPNVEAVVAENRILAYFAKELGATHLVRGIRNTVDFEYERAMCSTNRTIVDSLQTVFLMPPSNLENISSSLVRSLINIPDGMQLIAKLVPQNVFDKIFPINKDKIFPINK